MDMAKADRVEVKIVMRADVLERLDKVAELIKTSRHAVVEMLFSANDDVAMLAYTTIRSTINEGRD